MKRTTLAIAIGAICAGASTGLFAQDTNSQDEANGNESELTQQQDANNQQPNGNDDTMDVEVEQEPAEIGVEQESPEIRVEQSQPEVTIEQPEPEVTIEQPEPNVTVEEAEPNVTVEQNGEPDVNVDQAEDAQVDVNNEDNQEQGNRNDHGDSVMSHQVSDLEGMTVVNQEGEEIGDIQHIAQHNDSGDLYAIISVGGVWGFGSTDIALAIEEMQFEEEQLVVNTSYGSDEIEESSDDYNEDNYTQVDSDMTLSEAKQQQDQ